MSELLLYSKLAGHRLIPNWESRNCHQDHTEPKLINLAKKQSNKVWVLGEMNYSIW